MNKTKSLGESLFEELRLEEEQKLDQQNILPKLMLPQNIDTQKGESEYFEDYIKIGRQQVSSFLQLIFGTGYKKNNNLSFNQKQKILRYVFTKNYQVQDIVEEYQKDSKKVRTSLYKQIHDLEHLKNVNRIQFVTGLADSRNRLGTMGYCWGAALGSTLYITIMKNLTIWRRLAGFVTIFHLSGIIYSRYIKGKIVNYTNLDRFTDKLYPLFLDDLRVYKQAETTKILTNDRQAGEFHQDQIDTKLSEMRLEKFFEQKPKKKNEN